MIAQTLILCAALQFVPRSHVALARMLLESHALLQTSQGCSESLCRKRPQFISKWIAGLTGKELETEIAALSSEQMTALLTTLKPHLAAELLQVMCLQRQVSSMLLLAPVA